MKKLVLGLMAIVLFAFNVNAQNFQDKIKQLEATSKNLQANSKITLEEVKSANNDYDYCGLAVYNAIIEIQSITKAHNEQKSDYEKDVVPIIDNIQDKLPFRSLEFNQEEQLLFDSFVKDMKIQTALEKAKLYEEFINENFKSQGEVKNFLIALSEFKYTSYTKRRSLSSFESCVDTCMDRTFSGYNTVDWFFFVAGNPGRAVLQVFASCSWRCW